MPTWFKESFNDLPLAIGIQKWRNRTAMLVARDALSRENVPTVELNIPDATGKVNRLVNGCLCRREDGAVLLGHRGRALTATPKVIPKDVIHRHFAKWLETVEDDDRETKIIPVGLVGRHLLADIADFADQVSTLKQSWLRSRGSASVVRSIHGWREDLRFPKAIQRVVQASESESEYRHGPMQKLLKQEVEELLPNGLNTAFNVNADLAVLRGRRVLGIFEIKTNLGPQLYSGIGQLLWYRLMFGSGSTSVFLVIPGDCRPQAEIAEVGPNLTRIGVTLLLCGAARVKRWDNKELGQTLTIAGIPCRPSRKQ
ncbi:MAG: hypothetical protein FJY73_08225 [Candidatus Eisenbacteria bacterium]|nr:hypothetical protein [Candidatus Eisenbacteria bacterium]